MMPFIIDLPTGVVRKAFPAQNPKINAMTCTWLIRDPHMPIPDEMVTLPSACGAVAAGGATAVEREACCEMLDVTDEA